MATFTQNGVTFYFMFNLANTLCCIASLSNDTLRIEEWTRYLTASSKVIELNPSAPRIWVRSVEEPIESAEFNRFREQQFIENFG